MENNQNQNQNIHMEKKRKLGKKSAKKQYGSFGIEFRLVDPLLYGEYGRGL
jgi:hypothetical protein